MSYPLAILIVVRKQKEMRNEMTRLANLIEAKLDTWTAGFSDDPSAQKRDDETYASLLASQAEYLDDEVSYHAGLIWRGEKTRADYGMSA
jgi:hypothetical protein